MSAKAGYISHSRHLRSEKGLLMYTLLKPLPKGLHAFNLAADLGVQQ